MTVGPDGVAQVVSYYAGGLCQSFPLDEPDASVVEQVERLRPELVLLPADRRPPAAGPTLFADRAARVCRGRPVGFFGRMP